jgi:hypothetical protein
MSETLLIALLSFAGTLIGSVAGHLASARLTAYRIDKLEKTVSEHNGFARKMPVLEEKIDNVKEHIDSEIAAVKKEIQLRHSNNN